MVKDRITAFWMDMRSNDFARVAETHLHPEFEYYMPQTGEYYRTPEIFADLNGAYPGQGVWRFDIVSIVAERTQGVSDVLVTDGHMKARAITFHRIKDDLIWRQTEFWPDPYPMPEWRANFATVLDKAPF